MFSSNLEIASVEKEMKINTSPSKDQHPFDKSWKMIENTTNSYEKLKKK